MCLIFLFKLPQPHVSSSSLCLRPTSYTHIHTTHHTINIYTLCGSSEARLILPKAIMSHSTLLRIGSEISGDCICLCLCVWCVRLSSVFDERHDVTLAQDKRLMINAHMLDSRTRQNKCHQCFTLTISKTRFSISSAVFPDADEAINTDKIILILVSVDRMLDS